jgi:hypothetical protein
MGKDNFCSFCGGGRRFLVSERGFNLDASRGGFLPPSREVGKNEGYALWQLGRVRIGGVFESDSRVCVFSR